MDPVVDARSEYPCIIRVIESTRAVKTNWVRQGERERKGGEGGKERERENERESVEQKRNNASGFVISHRGFSSLFRRSLLRVAIK